MRGEKVMATKELLSWKEIEVGNVILSPGNAREYKTGDWRSQKPIWDFEKCILCGMCYAYCPDAAIMEREDGYYEANYYYCKGCGICAEECPKKAIRMVEE